MRINDQIQYDRFKLEDIQRVPDDASGTSIDRFRQSFAEPQRSFSEDRFAAIREQLARLAMGALTEGGSGSGIIPPNFEPAPLSVQTSLDGEVNLPDPTMAHGTKKANDLAIENDNDAPYAYRDFDGELFVDGADYTDVDQNGLADCYLMTALASLAHTNPDILENMITDHGDGTYTVHFKGGFGDVRVDDDLVASPSGVSLYAGTGDRDNPELWVAIIEKAYAKASGGYDEIQFGRAYKVIAQLTGVDERNDFIRDKGEEFDAQNLSDAIDEGRTVTVRSVEDDKKIEGYEVTADGIVSNHAYAVLDVRRNDAGEWEVVLYNPWAGSGTTSRGAHLGEFTMSWEAFISEANFREVELMKSGLT